MGVFTFQCEIKKQNLHCVCLEFKPCFQNLLPSKQMLNIYFDKLNQGELSLIVQLESGTKKNFHLTKHK